MQFEQLLVEISGSLIADKIRDIVVVKQTFR